MKPIQAGETFPLRECLLQLVTQIDKIKPLLIICTASSVPDLKTVQFYMMIRQGKFFSSAMQRKQLMYTVVASWAAERSEQNTVIHVNHLLSWGFAAGSHICGCLLFCFFSRRTFFALHMTDHICLCGSGTKLGPGQQAKPDKRARWPYMYTCERV